MLIDPYFFKFNDEWNISTFLKWFELILPSLEEIQIFYDAKTKNKDSEEFLKKLKEKFPKISLEFKDNKEVLHDRYILDLEKAQGVHLGGSFNGLFKQVSSIRPLDKEDYPELLEILGRIR
ncbi:hypothetical protein FAI40_07460 [Acetobacteraceae bacterium]|nr:hypothetical protein FAI40_07460 [Acetobacteraceae bacterium]